MTDQGQIFFAFEEQLRYAAKQATEELIKISDIRKGQLLVVGCSSSEIIGKSIGKASSPEAAEAVRMGIEEALSAHGIYLCAQCCEHLNRAIVMERLAAEAYGYDPVCVLPQPHAGGSFATAVWKHMQDPVAVEHIRAHAGMDIGGTLIGMHLKEVAVPVRLSVTRIGEAQLLAARTRPKLIGGERAVYPACPEVRKI